MSTTLIANVLTYNVKKKKLYMFLSTSSEILLIPFFLYKDKENK